MTETTETLDPKALLEQEVIKTLLVDGTYFNQVIQHLEKDYFSDIGLGLVFESIKEFFIQHHQIPTIKEIVLQNKQTNQKDHFLFFGNPIPLLK